VSQVTRFDGSLKKHVIRKHLKDNNSKKLTPNVKNLINYIAIPEKNFKITNPASIKTADDVKFKNVLLATECKWTVN